MVWVDLGVHVRDGLRFHRRRRALDGRRGRQLFGREQFVWRLLGIGQRLLE
jgi:hypothetical protein